MTRKSPRSPGKARSRARLAAVQALYDADLTGATADRLLSDFIDHALGESVLMSGAHDMETEVLLAPHDPQLLTELLRGCLDRHEQLDHLVAAALSKDWQVARLESVLRAILRAGAYELIAMPATPARVVISEYVDVTGAFYGGPEPGMVNAVLERIARSVRAAEFTDR